MSVGLATAQKVALITEYGGSPKNTGSTAAQIALLTTRIIELTEHFKIHKKDHHSRQGLLKIISLRRKLLNYLMKTDGDQYRALLAKLGIRK